MTAVQAGSPVNRLPVLVVYVFRACLPARRLAAVALPAAAIALSGLLTHTITDRSATAAFAEVAGVAIFGLGVPLGALVIGDAVLGAEVRSGTFSFTWLTPTRFWEIAVARWLGGWLVALATLVPAAVLATLFGGVPAQAPTMALAVGAGTAAHVALFVLVGAVTRRAAVWSLAIVFLVERLLGAVLSAVAQLSPTWQARAVFVGLADAPSAMSRSGIPEGWGAVTRLALLTVVWVAVAAFGLRRLQLTGSRD